MTDNNPLDKALTERVEKPTSSGSASVPILLKLIQLEQYVGEVFGIAYEKARIQVNDYHRRQVGGIPSLSFLLATRMEPGAEQLDADDEDSSVILLRVVDATNLPNAQEAERVRVEVGQKVSGEAQHWDDQSAMDTDTRHLLNYAGIECRILGTFYMEREGEELVLRFGSDISNYYPNRGLKVYKPADDALRAIVNYVHAADLKAMQSKAVIQLGHVRYASTNRMGQRTDDVPVEMRPADILRQKTAVFGMTRTGKSNTVKIVAQAIHNLRVGDGPRAGQVIFDPNGEYANANVQDEGSALKAIGGDGTSKGPDVETYGVVPNEENDPGRNLMRINFYADEYLQTGKGLIDSRVAASPASQTNYASNFRDVVFEKPAQSDVSATKRYDRRVLCYRALLHRAGFEPPGDIEPSPGGLFGQDLLRAMRNSTAEDKERYARAAGIFRDGSPTWGSMAHAMEILHGFVTGKDTGYKEFNQGYVSTSSTGEDWADSDLRKLLAMIRQPNGSQLIGGAKLYHSPSADTDYADDVYDNLQSGKLVIIDQSTGDPGLNKEAADRVMWRIFNGNQEIFRDGAPPPDILVYVEEAHNQLPSDRDADMRDIWVRTAKEGAKLHIGMVYATQEVSAIQRNILKNTSNWFIGHLNNTDETRELRKYYDFADFEKSILRAQDKGFLRVKTLSNPFVVPVQVKAFDPHEVSSPAPPQESPDSAD